MNLNLRQVYCTNRDGDRFWKIPHVYVRGNTIKYLSIQEEVMGLVKEEVEEKKGKKAEQAGGRGRGRGRGGGAAGKGGRGRGRLAMGGGGGGGGSAGRGQTNRGGRGKGRGAPSGFNKH